MSTVLPQTYWRKIVRSNLGTKDGCVKVESFISTVSVNGPWTPEIPASDEAQAHRRARPKLRKK